MNETLNLDSLLATRSDAAQAGAVFRQLLADYEAKDLGWVLAGQWRGPEDVPLAQIDFSKRATWKASSDGKIAKHAEMIESGKSPPAILVKPPSGKFVIVDGHHRALASEALDQPLKAYWAQVQVPNGPFAGGCWEDLSEAMGLARMQILDSGAAEATDEACYERLRVQFERARDLVSANPLLLGRLAGALLDKGQITFADAKGIVGQ